MKVDFETLAAIMSFVMNAAGVATLALLLSDKELIELYEELSKTIKTRLSNYGFVLRKRQNFGKTIFSPLVILLHLFNLVIFMALYLILIIGPENIHAAIFSGTIAEPLTLLEKIIYMTVISLNLLAYLSRCFVPTIRYLALYRKTKNWLNQNEPHRSST